MDQVCLLEKILNCFLILGLISPGIIFNRNTVSTMVRGKANHILMYLSASTPTMEVIIPTRYKPRILPKAAKGVPGLGVITRKLFIPNQPAKAKGTKKTSHTNPAF